MQIDPITVISVESAYAPIFYLNQSTFPSSYYNQKMKYSYTVNASEGAAGQKKIVGSLNETMPGGMLFSLKLEPGPGAISKGKTLLGEAPTDLVLAIPVPSQAANLTITATCTLVAPISTSFARILTLTLMDN